MGSWCGDVSKADGSVGRIFEGHLNGYERLTLDGIDPEDHLLGVWGADPLPDEGTAAYSRTTRSTARRCSARAPAGSTAALVIAKGTLVYVDLHDHVEIDKSWYRCARHARVGEPPGASSTARP